MALSPRPKLLILLIVEQLRPEYIAAAAPQFGTGGLKRLLEKGAWFPDCRHAACAFPLTSLATLATGAWPSQHGIVADSWYDRQSKSRVSASDEALLATTLSAQVAAADPKHNRVFVISLDAPQGWLYAGTPAAHVYWMDDHGRFITRGTPPDWLAAFNTRVPIENHHDAAWSALGARTGAPALRILTFDPAHPAQFLALYKASPFGQSAQFDLLAEMLVRENLGRGDSFDFVSLLCGSSELLGYEVGGDSPLMPQMILQLDRRVETLLNQLDSVFGQNGFDFVLAGAHGAPPLPSDDTRARTVVNGETIADAVDKALAAVSAGRVRRYLYPFLYLDPAPDRDPEEVRKLAVRAAFEFPAVAGFYTAGAACSTHDEFARRFANSFHLKRCGDLMLSYRPGYVEDYGQPGGISYGSLYNYDVRVPLCFYGQQFRPGSFEAPVESVDLAPTLARAMGAAVPSSSVGRVLGEAFQT
ncbi:MAG TPA: alkaline phosphatase family protein [Verrucomicrobiae bacterium]|nr:alkaline phosphatase family protein [Verrucomicrobiae bacterium]